MSLINQMLRDLDSRPETGRSGTVRAVNSQRRSRLWLVGGLVLAAGLGVVIAFVEPFFGSAPTAADGNPTIEPEPAAREDGTPASAGDKPVRLTAIEQVSTREGPRLRLAFSGDSDYRRRAAEADRLVIETPAEPVPELDQTLPPAVEGIERIADADEEARLVVRLTGWRAGPLVAEAGRDGGDRLLLTLEPVQPVAAEPEPPVVDTGKADDSAETEPAGAPAGESESLATEISEQARESANPSNGVSTAPAETETAPDTANADQPAEASMSRQRREPTPSERAAEHWSAAREAAQAGRVREAESAMRRVLALVPGHVPARTALTELLVEQGRLGDADQLLAEAATAEGLAPGDRGYFLRQRARLWMNADDFERAIELLEAAAPDPAGEPETASLLAGLYYRAGRHQSAVDWYEALLESPPRRSAWWMGLGLAREAVGEYSAAVTAYRRALEGDGLRPSVRDYLSERIRELDGRN